jgi:hypothetical protein
MNRILGESTLYSALLRRRTAAGLKWISEKLAMDHPSSVSRLVGAIAKNPELAEILEKMEKMLKCENRPQNRGEV